MAENTTSNSLKILCPYIAFIVPTPTEQNATLAFDHAT